MTLFPRTAADTGAAITDTGITRTIMSRFATDTYADGASTSFGAATSASGLISVYVDAFDSYVTPPNVDVPYMARLPHNTGQDALGTGQVRRGVTRNVNCSWHGRIIHPERGAFAVVRAGGPLEDLIGSRVRISTRAGVQSISVVAYVAYVADLDVRDEISVARTLFIALAALGQDRLAVSVDELGTL